MTTRRLPSRRLLLPLGLAALLAGCGAPAAIPPQAAGGPGLKVPGINCAPFARELSGIALYGDADSWWHAAAGRYARSERPATGSVLVFRRTSRLRSGHVSVVTRVVSARQILVTQANWVRGHVHEDQLVVDVSPANDWSEVRVWFPPAGTLGSHVYAAHGFIHPRNPATYAELARATPIAARYALDTQGRPAPRARLRI